MHSDQTHVRSNRGRFISLTAFVLTIGILAFSACGGIPENPPLPRANSVQDVTPAGKLPAGQIAVPLPYGEPFGGIWEQWVIDQDTSGTVTVKVIWNSQTAAVFPVSGPGTHGTSGSVTLGKHTYRAVSTTIYDTLRAGWIVFAEVPKQ